MTAPTTVSATPPTTVSVHAKRPIALLVAGCFFMELLDTTIVSTSAPAIGRSLGTGATSIGLVLSAYLMSLAVFLPTSGWLAGRWSARRVLLAAIGVFTLASLGCALSTSLPMLIGFRIAQGIGGAMMVPVGRAMVLANLAKPDIPKVMAYVIWPGLLAPVIAPLAGGLITSYLSWRWLFAINVPLGAVAMVVALVVAPSGHGRASRPLDRIGTVLVAVGLGALAWVAHLVSDTDAAVATCVAMLAGAAIALGLSGVHLLRTEHPLLDVRLLRIGTFRVSAIGGSLFWVVVMAVPFLLPLQLQTQWHWSGLRAGAALAFVFVGNIGIKPATTWMNNRIGPRHMILIGGLLLAGSTAALATLTSGVGAAAVGALCLVSGVGRSIALTAYSTIAFADVDEPRMRDANVLVASLNQMAMGVGVAAATAVLGIANAVAGRQHAFAIDWLVLAGLTLAAVLGALRLPAGSGDQLRARRP